MAKKMTLKEFKEVFNELYSFEIFGWEGILNLLACEAQYSAKDEAQLGLMAIAGENQRRHDRIMHILEAKGYYDN